MCHIVLPIVFCFAVSILLIRFEMSSSDNGLTHNSLNVLADAAAATAEYSNSSFMRSFSVDAPVFADEFFKATELVDIVHDQSALLSNYLV